MILVQTQCFPPSLGGIEGMMRGLAQYLHGAGESVLVQCDGKPTPIDRKFPFKIRRFAGFKPLRRTQKAFFTNRLLHAGQITAVFCDTWKSAEGLKPGAAPLICLAHGAEFVKAQNDPKRAKRIVKALTKASAIVANSADTAERIRSLIGDDPRIQIIPPPIDPRQPLEPSVVKELQTRFADADPLILSLCRLEPRKGVDRVITAMSELAGKYPRAQLVVAGAGADKARLAALAQEKDVGERTTFLGAVSDHEKSALYHLCDLFAMPVRREGASVEGFGITYLEAACFRAPSLAGRAGGAADAVADEKTGLLCDGADQADVTRQLERLLSDPQLRARLGAQAAKHAETASWPNAIHRYLQLIAAPR